MARVLCVGHAVQDFVFGLPSMPTQAAKYRADSFTSIGGGPAATAAVTIARLGGQALLAARVGEDSVADAIIEELRREGVDCDAVRRLAGLQSSLSAVLLDARGERTIVNYRDPRWPADATWLPDPGMLAADVVLADTRWPEGALHALRAARERGLPAVLDADRPIPEGFAALQAAATHVAFSADGLAEWAGHDDPRAALLDVAGSGVPWCCVTLGERGVLVAEQGKFTELPAFAVPVVDTLGAGDVWHGAFALALAEGKTALAACAWASAAAALKVQRTGGRSGAPRRAELDDFIARHG